MAARSPTRTLAYAAAVVVASMVLLFTVPPSYFIAATFVSMTCMIVATTALTRYRGLLRPRPLTIAAALVSAVLLYLVFYGGNAAIQAFHPLGLSAGSENSIYSLIASSSNPPALQVSVLAFDAVGYESFFRGVLQTRMEPRLGAASPFVVAVIDAGLHIITLNPLWVVTTFIADSAWGLTYRYSRDLTASVLSHFIWDIAIFLVFPVG